MASILPRSNRYARMPPTSTAAATRNGLVKDWELPTRYPVITGASTPGKLATKFIIPATRAVLPGGAIRPGIDHPTGADAANPHSATEIQTIAVLGDSLCAAPATANPKPRPMTRIV